MSIVHDDLYEPGCRTPQPPIRRWKAPPRRIPPSQRPYTARCRGPQQGTEANPLATTLLGVSAIPRVLPLSATLTEAIMGEPVSSSRKPNPAISAVVSSPVLGQSDTPHQRSSFGGGMPCADDTQDQQHRIGGGQSSTSKYLSTAKRIEFSRYDYKKFTRSEAQRGVVAVGPAARGETFLDRTVLVDQQDQNEEDGDSSNHHRRALFESGNNNYQVSQRRRTSPTKPSGTVAGGPAILTKDPNFINRYLYSQVAETQELQKRKQQDEGRGAPHGSIGDAENRATRGAARPSSSSGRTNTQHQRLMLHSHRGMPGVSGNPTPTMLSGTMRQYYEGLVQEEEAVLYAAEVEKVRREGIGQKAPMRLHDLKVDTFDANLPPDSAHRQLEKDIARDDFLLKRKRLREGELDRRAILEQRVKSARAAHQEKMQWSFERSLALDLPHTKAKAQEAVTQEWTAQMEEDAVLKGYNLNAAAKAEQREIASTKAAKVLSGVRAKLRASQPSFGITPKEAKAEAGLSFLKSPQQRPQGLKLSGVESQRIVHRIKKRVPLKPPRPQLACDVTSPHALRHHSKNAAQSNIVDCPADVEREEAISGVRGLPTEDYFSG